jgi:hypothetical protein
MSAKWVLRGGIVLLVVAVAAGVTVYSLDSPDKVTPRRRHVPDPEYPRLTRAMMRYEQGTATLAFDYRDEKVSAREWLQTSDEQLPKMVSALSHLDMRLFGTFNRHAADLRTFVRLAQDELEALFDLREAIADSDSTYEAYAWDHWSRAVDRKHHFLSGYYGRRQGIAVDYAGMLPSIPLKSLA